MSELIVFVLERPEAEFLYVELQDLADAKLDAAEVEHDKEVGEALDHIADQLHAALYEGGNDDES